MTKSFGQMSKAQQRVWLDEDLEKFRQDRHQMRKKMLTDGTLTLTKEGSTFCLRMDGWCLAFIHESSVLSKMIDAVCDTVFIMREKEKQNGKH